MSIANYCGFTRILGTGAPAPGYKIAVYFAGTENTAPIFSDNQGTVDMANPFLSDDNGFFLFYVANGRYDISIADPSGLVQVYVLPDQIIYDPPGI